MSTDSSSVYRRKTGFIAALAVLLAAAAVGIYFGVTANSAGTARPPHARTQAAQVIDRTRVTSADVTGYAKLSASGPSTRPFSVKLHGAPAASLYRTVERLRAGNSTSCAEESLTYQIAFTAATGNVDVSGYACGRWVDIKTGGKASEWTDARCTLDNAVRRILPVAAVDSREPIGNCAN